MSKENKMIELCGRCVHDYSDSYELKKVSGGTDNKVTCSACKRRSYGATYEIVGVKRKNHDT